MRTIDDDTQRPTPVARTHSLQLLAGPESEFNRVLSMVCVMAGKRVRIRIFTTCPQTKDVAGAGYAERFAEFALERST